MERDIHEQVPSLRDRERTDNKIWPMTEPPEFKAILAKYGNPEISPKTVEITKAVRDLKLELD